MKIRAFLRRGLVAATVLGLPGAALAQSSDNAVESAEDAFGTATQHEQIGVYDENNVRGFSPGTAGNFRMEGLYFDIQGGLGNRVIDGELIRVGPAAQGYAFPAPTGIVDLSLKKAGDKPVVSTFLQGDSFGAHGLEFDAQLPLAGKQLSLSAGVGVFDNHFANGGSSIGYNVGLVPRWRPAPNVELLAFANHQQFNDNTSGPVYITTGNYIPPHFDGTRFSGPGWAKQDSASDSFGLIGHANLGDWTLRSGLFHSRYNDQGSFANLVFIQPDLITTDRQVYAAPDSESASWSGEFRLSRRFHDGPRQHLFTASLRGRAVDARYGGGDLVDLGNALLGEEIVVPPPIFAFSEQTMDDVHQATGGLSYSLKWKGIGEFTAGLSRTHYVKRVTLPGPVLTRRATDATLPYFSAALTPLPNLTIYGSYVRGLEDAGSAPGYASNANEVLEAIRTRQFDVGVRWSPVKDTTLIVGYFQISKPYIDIDTASHYGVLGEQTHRGVEFSITSNPTSSVRIVAGGVWLDPRVTAAPSIAQPVGLRPVGQPRLRTRFNINWTPPFAKNLTLDAYWNRESGAFATVDNAVYAPGAGRVGAGGRYRFKLAGHDFTGKVGIYNIFDTQFFIPFGSGAFGHNTARNVQAWLSTDF
ncbi:MAG: TonB-dependent receptor domain-containing protein [Novosphingobium sp.]